MKYMLLIYSPEDAWTQEEWQRCAQDSSAIRDELARQGKLHDAAPLHPVKTAKTVRVRAGRPIVTDGPFMETREQLGGYFLIDADNLDQAVAIASRLPAAHKGTIEIRPVLPLDGLPAPDRAAPAHASSLRTFMFLCYDDPSAWEQAGPEALRAAMQRAVALTHTLHAQGRFVDASPLHPPSTATSVRVRNNTRTLTDGPFMETREVLGGFYVIRARDHADALSFAAQHPGAPVGAVEVREVMNLAGLVPA